MSERQLIFRDLQGHQSKFAMGDRDHLKFSKSFNNFMKKHVSEENTTFRIERVLTDEVLIIETALGIIGRERHGDNPETSYCRYERRTDGSDLQLRFAYSGYGALNDHGQWSSNRENLLPDESFENLELEWVRDLQKREQQRCEIAALPKLDKKALNRFCKVWADTGYNEYVSDSEIYYVLFDSRTLAEVGADRAEMLKLLETMGLHQVDTPVRGSSGEVWVRSDPRVDVELEKWG